MHIHMMHLRPTSLQSVVISLQAQLLYSASPRRDCSITAPLVIFCALFAHYLHAIRTSSAPQVRHLAGCAGLGVASAGGG